MKTEPQVSESGMDSGSPIPFALTNSAPVLNGKPSEIEELLWALMKNSGDSITIVDREGRLLWGNDCGQWALQSEESNTTRITDWLELWGEDERSAAHAALLAGTTDGHGQFVGSRSSPSGVLSWWETSIVPLKHATGESNRLLCISRDVTEKRQSERRVRQQAEYINHAREAFIAFDLDERVTVWNQGAERIFGWCIAEVIDKTHLELFGTGSARLAELAHAAFTAGETQAEICLRTKTERCVFLEVQAYPLCDDESRPNGCLYVASDITERRRLEEQAIRSQRLEGIGLLAAGIAHDFNNILSPILLSVSMLRVDAKNTESRQIIETLEHSVIRGQNLVRQMLSFARGTNGERQQIDIKHLLRDIVAMVRETFPKHVRLETLWAEEPLLIEANPTQIHQVLFNLCVNARDAMPEGGTLRITARSQTLDKSSAEAHDGAQPGRFVVLEVSDTGTGIHPDVLGRIWEPFFTTKGPDKGTGLGLSTVKGIVKSHHGFISLNTTAGRGTKFKIWLPTSGAPIARNQPLPLRCSLPGVGKLILLVLHEKSMRGIFVEALIQNGYRVLLANDGADAETLIAQHGEGVSLVVTDPAMTRAHSSKFLRNISRLNPATKILTLHDAPEPKPVKASQDSAARRATEQFRVEQFLSEVCRLLHRPGASP